MFTNSDKVIQLSELLLKFQFTFHGVTVALKKYQAPGVERKAVCGMV